MDGSATIIAFLIGTAINTWVMAYGARRLLDTRFPLFRTLVAGAVGQAVASPIISALIGDLRANRDPRRWGGSSASASRAPSSSR